MVEHTLLRKLESLWGIPIFMQMKQEKISGVLGFFPKTESADCIRGIAPVPDLPDKRTKCTDYL